MARARSKQGEKKAAQSGRQRSAPRRNGGGGLGRAGSVAGPAICFTATLLLPRSERDTDEQIQPAPGSRRRKPPAWLFLLLPKEASVKLPSRGQVTVRGILNAMPFQATLEPDGRGGHWLKVDGTIWLPSAHPLPPAEGGGEGPPVLQPGDVVTLEIAPVPPDQEPEPKAPPDLRRALAAAPKKSRETWSDITPVARRDWIAWIVSAKQEATRARRITAACDMLAKGKRRPCCFDRSGMYGKGISCPVAEPL